MDTKIKHKLVDTEYNARSKACEEIRIIARNLFGEIKSISQLNNFQQIEVCKHLSFQKQHFLNFVLSENIRVKSMVTALKIQILPKQENYYLKVMMVFANGILSAVMN